MEGKSNNTFIPHITGVRLSILCAEVDYHYIFGYHIFLT